MVNSLNIHYGNNAQKIRLKAEPKASIIFKLLTSFILMLVFIVFMYYVFMRLDGIPNENIVDTYRDDKYDNV